jgi:outer membrane protein assembly factor BamA
MLVLVAMTSCEPTWHLQRNAPPLLRSEVKLKGVRGLAPEIAQTAIKTRPNKIAFLRLELALYNVGKALANDSSLTIIRKNQKINFSRYLTRDVSNWLTQTVGQPPVQIDEAQLIADCKNLENLYFSKGFLTTRVRYQVKRMKRNPKLAEVVFHVDEGPAYVIQKRAVLCENPRIKEIFYRTDDASHIQVGDLYNEENLAAERSRLSEIYRDSGYYRFTPRLITYDVDTTDTTITGRGRRALPPTSLWQRLGQQLKILPAQTIATRSLDLYIRLPDSVYVYTVSRVNIGIRRIFNEPTPIHLYAPELTNEERKHLHLPRKTFSDLYAFHYYVSHRALQVLNLNVVSRRVWILPNYPFNLSWSRYTQQGIQELGIFSNSLMRYVVNDSLRQLQAELDLTLASRWFMRTGLELFQSEDLRVSGNLNANLPGFGVSLQLSKKNAFKGAEQLDFSGNFNINLYQQAKNKPIEAYLQGGARVGLNIPGFLFLRNRLTRIDASSRFFNFYSPRTILATSYTIERPQVYERTTVNFNLEYQWNHRPNSNRVQSSFTPLNFSLISSRVSDNFLRLVFIENPVIQENPDLPVDSLLGFLTFQQRQIYNLLVRDFQDRFSSIMRYSRTWTLDYGKKRDKTTWFFRAIGEIGGLIPLTLDALENTTSYGDGSLSDAELKLFGNASQYAVYVKATAEAKAFIPFGKESELVLRAYGGIAPTVLRNTDLLFENRFYAGGASSVRGWQSNTLGPGTYPSETNRLLPIGGDCKLEFNAEFRFDVVNPIELALFVDAGNTWFIPRWGAISQTNPQVTLNNPNLLLGLAAGVGVRFDFSFFVIRLDIGQQVYAPERRDWVIKRFPKDLGANGVQYNIGIGYPF